MTRQVYHRYLPIVARRLCVRIAEGEALAVICQDPKMPPMTTVFHWLATEPDFRALYARARELLADTVVDEIRTITQEAEAGQSTPARAAMTRLQVESRKWMAARLAPGRYGEQHDPRRKH